MAKEKVAYVCENCGQESAKWIGKCPNCGQWNTFKEVRHGGAATMFGGITSANNKPMNLRDISTIDEPRLNMLDTELNRTREYDAVGW